jgi:uncharacterized protein (DUF1800 family)
MSNLATDRAAWAPPAPPTPGVAPSALPATLSPVSAPAPAGAPVHARWRAAGLALSALPLAACGGGGEAAAPASAPPPVAADPNPTDAQASRFLGQVSMGATRSLIDEVKRQGYRAWLDAQIALPREQTRWDWLMARGYDAIENRPTQTGFDPVAWRKLLAGGDTVRQRMTFALSQILVISIDGLTNAWRQFAAVHWLDTLEEHAFGNLRTLLGVASRSLAMGAYLTFRGNAKANATNGSSPDENYARELMQLFMIGLQELNEDGSLKLVDGQPQETYTQADITGLARVFTGWDADLTAGDTQTPPYHRRPMLQVDSRYETGAKTFMGLTIPAGTDAVTALNQALDHLYAHPNVPPFWSRQLIQRLVTSNPSPAYVRRVARVFANDGNGQRGILAAVLRAIVLDDEARGSAGLTDARSGKLREPVLRFAGWARAFQVQSPSDAWAIGNTSDSATRLGQSPLRSPSVFNFFRPGYVPPNSAIGQAGLVAPEFQITHESSVVGYLNFMQGVITNGRGDVRADYSALLPLADDPTALVAEIDLLLAASQLSAATRKTIADAVTTLATGTATARAARVQAATLMVMACPEYLVQK